MLLITGPVGVGKTSVVSEMSEILERYNVPHAAVDVDLLAWYFPRPASDPFGNEVTLRNLSAVWRTFQEAGAERLLLARVIESRDELDSFRHAVPGAEIVVCRLRATVSTLQSRVRERERGSGRAWHVARAAELAAQFERMPVEDLVVETEDRTLGDIAMEILSRVGWIGSGTSGSRGL